MLRFPYRDLKITVHHRPWQRARLAELKAAIRRYLDDKVVPAR